MVITLRPLHVDDMASLMIREASHDANNIVDAVGPDRFTYRELVEFIASTIDIDRPIIEVPPIVGLAVSKLLNPIIHDVIITRQEITNTCGLLDSQQPATERNLTHAVGSRTPRRTRHTIRERSGGGECREEVLGGALIRRIVDHPTFLHVVAYQSSLYSIVAKAKETSAIKNAAETLRVREVMAALTRTAWVPVTKKANGRPARIAIWWITSACRQEQNIHDAKLATLTCLSLFN